VGTSAPARTSSSAIVDRIAARTARSPAPP